MAVDNVFPQSGDKDDAARFGQLIGLDNRANYVERGLSLNADFAAGELNVSEGFCYITVSSDTAGSDGAEILNVGYAVQSSASTVTLPSSGVVYPTVQPNIGIQDAVDIILLSDESAAAEDQLILGTVDIDAETVTERNRNPDATFSTLTVTDDASGVLATKTEAQGYATTAENNANSYTDSEISALDSELQTQIDSNTNDITALQSNKLDASAYTPVADVDGAVSVAASSVSGLDSQVDTNSSDISALQSNKLDASDYTPVADVDGAVSVAASSVSGLDSQVDQNRNNINSLQSNLSTLQSDFIAHKSNTDAHNSAAYFELPVYSSPADAPSSAPTGSIAIVDDGLTTDLIIWGSGEPALE